MASMSVLESVSCYALNSFFDVTPRPRMNISTFDGAPPYQQHHGPESRVPLWSPQPQQDVPSGIAN